MENVHITDPDLYDKLAKLENDAWVIRELDLSPARLTLNGAIMWLNAFVPDEPDESPTDAMFTVYGDAGLNRYYVQSDGYIRFSKMHSYPKWIELAKSLGFILH